MKRFILNHIEFLVIVFLILLFVLYDRVVNTAAYRRLEELQGWKANYEQGYCPYCGNKIDK